MAIAEPPKVANQFAAPHYVVIETIRSAGSFIFPADLVSIHTAPACDSKKRGLAAQFAAAKIEPSRVRGGGEEVEVSMIRKARKFRF